MASIELHRDDDGSTHPAAIGDEITLMLAETPTSGYRWQLESVDTSVLEMVHDAYEPPNPARLGGEGQHRWIFRVAGLGSAAVRLALGRSWDPDSMATSFEVTIDSGLTTAGAPEIEG